MPAYVVALIESISDAERYMSYVTQVQATLAPFGGKFIARVPGPHVLEGGPAPSRAVILEFPGVEQVRAWHSSPGYQPVAQIRRAASNGSILLLPAYDTSAPHVPIGQICYVEIVSRDTAATGRVMEAIHGWSFAPPSAELGSARVATLAGGAEYAIRAPMHDQEQPVTRVYVRVPDITAAARSAEENGATLLVPPMPIPDRGQITIWNLGGVEQGAWEFPAPSTP